MNSDGIRGVCFKVIYLMTNQNLSSTFKHNIFLTDIIANVPLRNGEDWYKVKIDG